jgi:putative hemolysin
MGLEVKILTLAFLILLSGIFSGTETALFSLSRLKLRHLVKKKVAGAETIEKLKDNPQRLLITILLGNNVVNIWAAALATSLALEFSVSHAIGITTGVMTFLILVFGEIVPKSFAAKYSQQISMILARPLLGLQVILFPVIALLEVITNLFTNLVGIKERPLVTEEELKTFVTVGHEVGEIKENERALIHRIFKFDDLEAKDVMTPRKKMICVDGNTKVRNILSVFKEKHHSRLPVYQDNLDHIVGFVHVLDFQVLNTQEKNKRVREVMRPVLFVPDSKKLDSLLKFFQRKKQHMAIIVDGYGTNIGLVTIEDVLEEIVGEIIDETEKIEPWIRKVGKRSFRVDGRADIDDINEVCKVKLPERDLPHSLSNYILNKIGRFPEVGEIIKFHKCEMEIKDIEKNTINFVIVRKKR